MSTIIKNLRSAVAKAQMNKADDDDDGRYSPTDQPLITELIHISDDDDLPPGEEAPPPPTVFEGPRRRPSRGGLTPPPRPDDPVDMDLGSENEAEIQFFKEQRNEASKWSDQPPPPPPPLPVSEAPQFVNESER